MSFEENEDSGRKTKIIVLSIILSIVVIFIIVFAIVEIIALNKRNAPPPVDEPPQNTVVVEQPKNDIFSNSYNEAITKKILTDDAYDYTGKYVFDKIGQLNFSESVTTEEKLKFLQDNKCYDVNDYLKKITDEKRHLFENVFLTIDKPINSETGSNVSYGTYIHSSPNQTLVGKIYGDKNLAVLVQDGTEDKEYWFISLRYKTMQNAVDVAEQTFEEPETMYLFENYYKDGKLFFSLTYVFKWN